MSIAVDKNDVRKLLEDSAIVEEIAKGVMEDPEALGALAEEIADELSDVLEHDPDFRAKIIQSAMGNKTFRDRLVRKLAASPPRAQKRSRRAKVKNCSTSSDITSASRSPGRPRRA